MTEWPSPVQLGKPGDDDPGRVWGELGEWTITLVTGDQVELAAHAFHREKDAYVFSVLMQGQPGYEVHIARFPKSSVKEIEGG
jgi:hypothetical protein